MVDTSFFLPKEITTEIITRLPTTTTLKSLVRFRSVCKTWRDIIDNARYTATMMFPIAAPATQSQTNDIKTSTFIFLPYYFDYRFVYILDLNKQEQDCRPDLCFSKIPRPPSPIIMSLGFISKSYVNGLFLFSIGTIAIPCMFIYNPATQEFVELPQLTTSSLVGKHYYIVPGFGFDSSSKQYKVVQLHYLRLEDDVDRQRIDTVAHVLTLGSSNSWRRLENVPKIECRHKRFSSAAALVNGVLHWLARGIHILSFDLASETFGFIACPPDLWLLTRHELKLINLSGSLTIVGLNSCSNYFKLWIMKDYNNNQHGSWTELIIDLKLCPFSKYDEILPICMWKNNEILLHSKTSVLVSYNFDSGQYNWHNVSDGSQ